MAQLVETTSEAAVRSKPFDGVYGGVILTLPAGSILSIVEVRPSSIGDWGRFGLHEIDAGSGRIALVKPAPMWIEMRQTKPAGVTPEPEITFTATPSMITRGQSSRLAWHVVNVEAVYLDGQGVAGSGDAANQTVTPQVTQTYSLRVVYGGGQSTTKTVTVTVNAPPTNPPPVTNMLIGVNALWDAEGARKAYDFGCRMFLICDNYPVARDLADKGAVVLFRKYVNGWKLNGDQIAGAILEAASEGQGKQPHPLVIHTLFNEWDSHGGGTPKELQDRANIEKRATEILLGHGTRVALGSFSVGTPDVTDPAIAAALRDYWAPIYNGSDRVYMDLHTYSPNMTHIMDDWYEVRWRRFFVDCGFDPRARRMLSGETGMDEGGIGGFPAHNATPDQVVKWCNDYRAISTQPIVVNGVTCPSPFIGGTIFQCGQNESWAGYDIRGYLGAMRDAGVWG